MKIQSWIKDCITWKRSTVICTRKVDIWNKWTRSFLKKLSTCSARWISSCLYTKIKNRSQGRRGKCQIKWISISRLNCEDLERPLKKKIRITAKYWVLTFQILRRSKIWSLGGSLQEKLKWKKMSKLTAQMTSTGKLTIFTVNPILPSKTNKPISEKSKITSPKWCNFLTQVGLQHKWTRPLLESSLVLSTSLKKLSSPAPQPQAHLCKTQSSVTPSPILPSTASNLRDWVWVETIKGSPWKQSV